MDKLAQTVTAARELWKAAEAEKRLAETVLISAIGAKGDPVSVVLLLRLKVAALTESADAAYLEYVRALEHVQEVLHQRSGHSGFQLWRSIVS